MRKYSFNHLLATLSCIDLAFILCCLPVHTFPIFGLESWFYAKSYQYILYPFTAVFFTGSIYMTLSVTIERYEMKLSLSVDSIAIAEILYGKLDHSRFNHVANQFTDMLRSVIHIDIESIITVSTL